MQHSCGAQVFVHRLRKYLGAYLVHLRGKVDAVVWSAGIGENSALIRALAMADLEVLAHTPCQSRSKRIEPSSTMHAHRPDDVGLAAVDAGICSMHTLHRILHG